MKKLKDEDSSGVLKTLVSATKPNLDTNLHQERHVKNTRTLLRNRKTSAKDLKTPLQRGQLFLVFLSSLLSITNLAKRTKNYNRSNHRCFSLCL